MTIPLVEWLSPSQTPALADNQVHIWRADLDAGSQIVNSLALILAPDERSRASRFVFERDRDRFVTCRGILRQIIAAYSGCSPLKLVFRYGIQGKPEVCMKDLGSPLHFNVSHSHGLAVYALSRQREVGIDTEFIRPGFDGEEIAERYFSAAELSELRGLAVGSRVEAFFLGWTRKEAYIKARGSGLLIPLDSFSVSLTPNLPVCLNSDDSPRWRLVSFQPGPQFAGAVAGRGQDWEPSYWTWTHNRITVPMEQ